MSIINKINKIVNSLIIAFAFGIFLYCIVASKIYTRDSWGQDDAIKLYEGDWYTLDDAGNKQPVEVPGKVDITGKDKVTIYTILPEEITEDTYLSFRSAKQEMVYRVDGEVRFAFTNKNTRHTGKLSPVADNFVDIHPGDAGKLLEVEFTTNSSYEGNIFEIYQGSQMAFWSKIFSEDGFELVVAIVLWFLSLIIVLVVLYARKQLPEMPMDIMYLAIGMLVVYAWDIANSHLRQLIFPNISIVSDLAYFMILLIPAPFLIYVNAIQKRRYARFLRALKIIVIADFFICSILHITRTVDFDTTFIYMASIDAVAVLSIIGTLIIDLVKGRLKEYKRVAAGILAIVVCGLIQMAMYMIHMQFYGGMIMSIGTIILLLCEIQRSVILIQNVYLDKIEAVNAKDARSKFLANMSHEIRTPINSVLGLDTMILRESREPGIRKYAKDIQTAGKSLLALINDILDFSKIESGKMEIVRADYLFTDLISDVVNMIRPKVEEKGLELITDIDENIPAKLYGDDVRIKQIIMNLLTNAVKYTNTGSVKLTARAKHEGDTAFIYFSVKDTGIGIKAEDIGKLSEEFVRIEESRNKNIEGTGLGMNIVISLLGLMGSKIEIDSVYGEGSDFYFTIAQPIKDASPIGNIEDKLLKADSSESGDDEVVDNQAMPLRIPNCRLLVVDDNSMNRTVFTHLLKRMECKIDAVESGFECLEMVQETKYDIIFMDHMMPEMDGIETLHRMKAMKNHLNADTPVVILTANAISGAKEKYLSEGFDDYITKPINPSELESMVAAFVTDDSEKGSIGQNDSEIFDSNMEVDLPYIDGVDWQCAMLKLRDEALLRDSVESFAMMAQSDIELLKTMYDNVIEGESEDSYNAYRVKVHSMKTSAATIGAYHVAGLAKYLEYAARDKDITVIKSIMPVFEREWSSLGDAVVHEFKSDSGGDGNLPPIDKDDLLTYLNVLGTAMSEYDDERADAIVEELSSYSYSEAEGELFEQIKLHVMNLDADGCEKVLTAWKQIYDN